MIYLALRQMLARKRQTFLIFLGIGFGTMVYVIVAGLQFGFRGFLIEQLLNNTSHVLISGSERQIDKRDLRDRFFKEDEFVKWVVEPQGKREEAKLENPHGWFELLEQDPNVKAFAPRLTISAIARQGRFSENINLTGIEPGKQTQVTSLEDYMEEGSLSELSGGNKIALGSEVLKNLGAQTGDLVTVSTGLGEPRPFKVVGKLRLGNEEVDKTIALTNIRAAQSLNRTPGRIGEIAVALNDISLSEEAARSWRLLNKDKVQNWEEANSQFMQMIEIQDIMRAILTGTILLVAGFGIYNTLSIMISQKKKDIAILRSIGYPPKKILRLFLFQGLALGALGGLLGCFLGLSVNLALGNYTLDFDVGKSNHLPISNDLNIYLTGFFMAQLASWVASYLPAKMASKLTPLDIFRSEL